MALDSIRSHKFRSALTVLGIVIGVSTVIAIASILTGLRENLVKLIEEYGTDNIYAFHLSTGFNPNQDREERTRKPLTEEDAVAIQTQTSSVEDIALVEFPDWSFNRTITYQGSHAIREATCRAFPRTMRRPPMSASATADSSAILMTQHRREYDGYRLERRRRFVPGSQKRYRRDGENGRSHLRDRRRPAEAGRTRFSERMTKTTRSTFHFGRCVKFRQDGAG